jgi:hypothetical protein
LNPPANVGGYDNILFAQRFGGCYGAQANNGLIDEIH